MKKFTLSILCSLCTVIALADPIDLSKASQLAANYIKDGSTPSLVNKGIKSNARKRKATVNSQPPYYIFSRGKGQGFVIVAGDDLLPEIIGYTETGDFDPDNIPPSFSEYLYGMELAIEKYHQFIDENGKEAYEKLKAKKAPRKARATSDIGPLMSSSWEQGWPYYDYCPWDTDNNARSLTGCVATSTSSVIHYWRNDNPRYLMTGTHAYTTWTHKLAVDPGYETGHPMKWELMQDSYGSVTYGSWNDHYTSVSELLAIVGDLVDMDYGADGSGAQSSSQPTALGAFNLTGTNTWYSGVNNMDTWQDLIESDLAAGRPILYSGYSVDANNNWSGHAFVLDGYSLSDGKYHFDFGWGSSWKGYYAVTDANGFNTDQSMTYQIHPKKLNLTAEISAPSFNANTNNTVTVTVRNNGTLDYTTAINLFCSTSPNQPTSWGAQQADWTTIPKGGSAVPLTFTVNPGSGDSWYLIVVDSDFHVLARVKVPTTETLTEVTSTYITNPSFETGNLNGWTTGSGHTNHIGNVSTDGNFVWRAVGLDGTRVLDSWVSGDKGNAISQTLTNLPSGYYKLTAKVATDPGNTVTVFAGENTVTTEAHECGKYYLQEVAIDNINVTDGTLQIGVQAGDWYKADDFRLYRYLVTPDTPTETVQNPTEGKTYFDITNAMAPWLSTASLGNYSNSGFAIGGWGNYTGSDGSSLTAPFIEKWTPSGNYLDNASIEQTLSELPNGTYYIGGSFIATSQGITEDDVEGVVFWAGDKSMELGTKNGQPEIFALEVSVTDGTLTFGLKTDCSTANWVAVDNLFLYWADSESSYYSQATSTTPVRVPIVNPRMETDLSGWTQNGSWQKQSASYTNFDPDFMECWINSGSNLSDRSVYQTKYLYAGTYQLSAAVNATQQGNSSLTVSGVSLKLGDTSVSCHTGNGSPEYFTTPKSTYTDGNYDLGLYISSTDANWVGWDNVVLYCYGAEVEEESEYARALRLCKEAQSEYEPSLSGAASSAISQYEWTDAELSGKSQEEINAAITILNNGTAIARASENATSMISNADFSGGYSGSASGSRVQIPNNWTFTYTYNGWNDTYVDATNNLFNAWAGTITRAELSQALSNLPNGTYRLSADVRVDNEAPTSSTALYGFGDWSNVSRSQEAGSEISGSTTAFATYSCAFEVTNHTATIGIRSDHSFYQIKNIKLEFISGSAATSETDAGYLRQDYYWNNRNNDEVDLTTSESVAKYGDATGVLLYPTFPNQIIYAATSDQFVAEQKNVVSNGTCSNLVITDGEHLTITKSFNATSATYTRSMGASTTWGTLCLPYPLTSDGNVQYYVLTSVSDSWMTYKAVQNVEPNTPVVYSKLTEDATSVTFPGNGSVVTTESSQNSSASEVSGWTMEGLYAEKTLDESEIDGTAYYIAQNKFWKANTTTCLEIPAFRAFFHGPSATNVKSFTLTFDSSTGILSMENDKVVQEGWYTLDGRRLNGRPSLKGVYIVDGQKVIIK